ncbi:MAG: MBL fold metallo-hydrolase [Caulobacterales bacterium]|nr:MBL fold metallo-hydrolase [Caulobacterales bacterium]
MKKFFAAALLALLAAFWWLFLDSRAPKDANGEFDIAAWRALIATDAETPEEIRLLIVGEDEAPRFAAETGAGLSKMSLVYTAVQIASPSMTTILGGAVDDLTAREIAQSKDAAFYPDAYATLQASYLNADQIFITHEHLDHVMAVTRHPHPETFASKLKLTAPQISALPRFAAPGEDLSPALRDLTPFEVDRPTHIAPGVVVAPAPGHTPGSLVFFVRRADGKEYLFIGDIVWTMTNINHLKTRPRILQYLFFDPDEDRPEVLRQVRALHDLAAAEPNLVIVPEHDGAYLEKLIETGAFEAGFK